MQLLKDERGGGGRLPTSSGAAASKGKARQGGRETGRVVAQGLEAKAQL